MKEKAFVKESDLCAAFIAALPAEWVAYPETGGFDILLVRSPDGFQIGVEAKLRLNAKVICQAAEYVDHYQVDKAGPDCRAVLVPEGVSADLGPLCPLLGITVIRMKGPNDRYWHDKFRPALPSLKNTYLGDPWHELAPTHRLDIPDYVPDVVAGAPAPQQLSPWKVAAIKIAVTLEKRGYVTRADFAHHRISMSRWTQMHWLVPDGKGFWKANRLPDFRRQHPVNFPQIEADYEKWKSPDAGRSNARQGALL